MDDRAAVVTGIRDAAHPITTVEPWSALHDLEPLAPILAGAAVVGVGESVRGARSGHELYQLKHRLLRFAVERCGFRAMALEESPASAATLDAYVRTGDGDAAAALATAWRPWQTEEFLDVLVWIRSFNTEHPDQPVRIVGVDTPGDHPLAHNTLAWHERTNARVFYWGGMAHTAGGEENVGSFPPHPSSPAMGPSDGSVLRRHLGDRYVSIGLTCHHGADGDPLPAPPDNFAESTLEAAGIDAYLLDLRSVDSEAARRWITSPATTRVIGPHYDPDDDAAYFMSGGSLADWFDVILHVQEITPAHYLPGY